MVRATIHTCLGTSLTLSSEAREFLRQYTDELQRYYYTDDEGMHAVYTAILPSTVATLYNLKYT